MSFRSLESLLPNKDHFYWVHIGINNRYKNYETNLEWKVWKQLLRQLKDEYIRTCGGFWCNRSLLLKNIKNMVIIVPKTHPKYVIGFYISKISGIESDINITSTISFFQSFIEGKGFGRMMVEYIRNEYRNVKVIVEEPLYEAIPFWKHLDVEIKLS